MQILLFGAGYKYSYLLTYLVEYSRRYSTEYSSSKKLDSHTPTHKSTFGVHCRTGSPGQLGLRVAGFPGHWVAGSQNVTQFPVCRSLRPALLVLTRTTLSAVLVSRGGVDLSGGGGGDLVTAVRATERARGGNDAVGEPVT